MTTPTYNTPAPVELTGELTVARPFVSPDSDDWQVRHPSAVLLADGRVACFTLHARLVSPFGGEIRRTVAPSIDALLGTDNSTDGDSTVLLTFESTSSLDRRTANPTVWWGHNLVMGMSGPEAVEGPVMWMALLVDTDRFTNPTFPGFTSMPTSRLVYLFTSLDEGLTWDFYSAIDSNTGDPNSLLNCWPWSPSILYDTGSAWVVASMRYQFTGAVRNMRPWFYVSTDLGVTWSATAQTNNELNFQPNDGHSRNIALWASRWLHMVRRDDTGTGDNPDMRWLSHPASPPPNGSSLDWATHYDPDLNASPTEARSIVNYLNAPDGDVWHVLWRGTGLFIGSDRLRVYRSSSTSLPTNGVADLSFVYQSEPIPPAGAQAMDSPILCQVGGWIVAMGNNYLLGLRTPRDLRFLNPLFVPHKKWHYELSMQIREEHNRQNWLRVKQWADAARLACLFHPPDLHATEPSERNWVAVEQWVRRCTPLTDVHIPYKRNPTPAQEERNWVFLEQWSRRVRDEPVPPLT